MKKIITSLFLLFTCISAIASHLKTGEITYKCLGGNLYEVKLSYFWDCAGGFNPGTQQTINIDGCSQTLSMNVYQSTLTPGNGVMNNNVCAGTSTTTLCNSRIDYIGTITLPGACNSWTFSIGSCCRAGNLINISGGTSASYYHFATLNNVLASCNNSPDFILDFVPVICGSQTNCINMGAFDKDGHNLSYALMAAYQTQSMFVSYVAGYSGAVPIPGITIDPTTGIIMVPPTMVGDYQIVVQVTEKDGTGNIIGTILRDFQITVTNCSNQLVCGQGNISNPTAGNIPSGQNTTLELCANTPFCFDVFFTDPNAGDSIKVTSTNLATNFPGATIVTSYTPGVTNSCKATICGTSSAVPGNYNFSLMAYDNVCPVFGFQIVNYVNKVLPAANAGADFTICGTQAATLNAVGPSTVFAWTDLNGNPIPVSSEFSCNPCNNPVIQPSVTTTYVLTNTGGMSICKVKDTLVVTVVSDFSLSVNLNAVNTCSNTTVSYDVIANPPGTYSYSWTPGFGLSSTSSASVIGTYSISGTYSYNIVVTNAVGCVRNIGSAYTVNTTFMPQVGIIPTYTNSFIGGTVNFDLNLTAGQIPTICGLSSLNCFASNTLQIGNGTSANSTTSYPAIFGNFYKNTRHQILFLANELNAAGIQPGQITSLAFNVSQINGTNTYPDFSIKMKCTSVTSLTNTAFDQSGLSQVFYAPTATITPGWNTYEFPVPYEWDGTSNILIDVCNSMTSTYTQNSSVLYTPTSFASVRWFNSDGTVACSTTASANSYTPGNTYRPNVKFGSCISDLDPNNYTYTWLPATGLNNPNIKNPVASVTGNQVYTVVVTPTAATTCSASVTATIDVVATTLSGNLADDNISIYPNPTDGLLVIEILKSNSYPDEYNIELTNALGEVVFMTRISNQNAGLNLKHLNTGIYFVSVSNANNVEAPYIKKIIIQK